MVLTHFLVTRFSVNAAGRRADPSVILPNHTTVNPLARHRLDKRFKLFEAFSLPSVLGQTARDFVWILIVDPALPRADRDRLRALTSPHPRTHLVEYDPAAELGRLGWLLPYAGGAAPTHIATTNVDDDDLMGVNFIAHVQQYLRETEALNSLPPCCIVGSLDPPQWDLMRSRNAPLGYLKPWHRGSFPAFTGYTVCCRQPEYSLSALAFEHARGATYFDPAIAMDDKTQVVLRATADRAGDDWRAWRPERHLHIVHTGHPQIIMTNHLENDQATRAFERWSTRRPVRGPSDFPEMSIRWDKVPDALRAFRRSPAAVARHFYRGLRLMFSSRPLNRQYKWKVIYSTLSVPVWFIRGLPDRTRRPGKSLAPAKTTAPSASDGN